MRSLFLFAITGFLISCSEPESEDPVTMDRGGESMIDTSQALVPSLDICVTEWVPFSYIIAEKPTGIMVELAQDIAKGLGYAARFHFMAPQRCYSETQQNHMDMSLFMSPLALARQGGQLSAIEPSVQNQMPILVVKRESSLQKFSSLYELSDKKIAGIRGNSFMLKNWEAGPKMIPVNRIEYLWQLLMSERVDAALGDFHSRGTLTPEQQQTVRFVLPPLEIEPIYWATQRDNLQLIEQFSTELTKRLSEGEVDHFYRHHLGSGFSELQQMIDSGHYEFTTPE